MKAFKPLDACRDVPTKEDIKLPVFGSAKLDGVRVLIKDGVALSKRMKPIPNAFIQAELGRMDYSGLDGEILIKGDFNTVQSAVMSTEGKPDFGFYVFDDFTLAEAPFSVRYDHYVKRVDAIPDTRIVPVLGKTYIDIEDLFKTFDQLCADGHEGMMLRQLDGPYKFGRSTMKQGYLLKLKPFDDSEAIILGVDELMRNLDTSCKKKDNLVPADTLGSLVCQLILNGEEFSVGSGFDTNERHRLWLMREHLKGKIITVKHQGLTKYGKPRFPIYKGIRQEMMQ